MIANELKQMILKKRQHYYNLQFDQKLKFSSFLTYNGNGWVTLPSKTGDISFFSSVYIQITMPKVMLVKGVWWSGYFQDQYNGWIKKIGKIGWKNPADDSMQTFSGITYLNRSSEGGKQNLSIIFFQVPIWTSQIR